MKISSTCKNNMDKKISNEKLIKELEKILPELSGINKESILFKIKLLKLSSCGGDSVEGLNFTKVSKQKLEEKISREKNLLSGYRKLINTDPNLKKTLDNKCDYTMTKLYFLNKELRRSESLCGKKDIGDKTSGKVSFSVVNYECDPIYRTNLIEFVVDLKPKASLKPIKDEKVCIDLDDNREFEIIVKGNDDKILGMLFFPCEDLLNLDYNSAYLFNFQHTAILRVKINFERKRKIARKNAEIVAGFKEGHELVSYHKTFPFYCCVCDNMVSLFYESYRCKRCKYMFLDQSRTPPPIT